MKMTTAWMNLTDFCDNKCLWCYGKGTFSNSKVLQYEKAINILNWIVATECTSCILIGGEPTLHPQIIDLVKIGTSIGLNMAIVSNGRRFSNVEFCTNMKDAGLKPAQAVLSMSSYSAESAVGLTGSKNSYLEFCEGFKNLVQLGLNPGVNIVISKPLINHLESMLSWVAQNNGNHVAINLCVPTITPTGADLSFCLPPDMLAKKTLEVYKFGRDLGIGVSFLFNTPYCLLSHEHLNQLLDADVIRSGCSVRSRNSLLFNVEGDLISCNHLSSCLIHSYVDIKEAISISDAREFFQADQTMTDVQKATCVYRSSHCKTCEYWDVCSGGCPIYWAGYDPAKYILGIDSQRKEVSI